MKLLHIGCGNIRPPIFINTDKDEMDISKPWPYEDRSVDGIVSMCVFQCLTWKELIFAFKESYRVLKAGGVMRMGVVLEDTLQPLDTFLYGNNINLFSFDLLKRVLLYRVGYDSITWCKYRESAIPLLGKMDNRHGRGTSYLEIIK